MFSKIILIFKIKSRTENKENTKIRKISEEYMEEWALCMAHCIFCNKMNAILSGSAFFVVFQIFIGFIEGHQHPASKSSFFTF